MNTSITMKTQVSNGVELPGYDCVPPPDGGINEAMLIEALRRIPGAYRRGDLAEQVELRRTKDLAVRAGDYERAWRIFDRIEAVDARVRNRVWRQLGREERRGRHYRPPEARRIVRRTHSRCQRTRVVRSRSAASDSGGGGDSGGEDGGGDPGGDGGGRNDPDGDEPAGGPDSSLSPVPDSLSGESKTAHNGGRS